MNEIDAVVQVLHTNFVNILKSKTSPDIKKGNIGEIFVRYAVKQSFWNRNYKIETKGNNTFTIHKQYRAYEGKKRGMDHYLKFRVKWWKTYKCFIEVKNWKHYKNGISDDTFKNKILKRFTKYDIFRRRCWILAINKRNIPYIKDNCRKHNIFIVPIKDHITRQYIAPFYLKPILEDFIDDFSKFVDGLLSNNVKYGTIAHIKARRQ